MQISYNWLKALLPDMTQSPHEVADVLTRHSFETVVAGVLEAPAGVLVVRIEKLAKHPNADRLQLATVTDGEKEVVVVCGAPNIAVGQVVPYSSPGVVLLDEEGLEFTVKTAKIRGEESPGMLNSLRELGMHPTDHGGIWVLPDDLPLGSPLSDHFPQDTVLEADITADRAHDCMSHLGVARELAALLRLPNPELELVDLQVAPGNVSVVVEDESDSGRYIAVELSGATQSLSPMWMQARLLAAGGKPKSNVVDATNYVLFEVGNPTHVFDADTLPSKTITVRRAKTGESVVALDENTYSLTTDDLVIASGDTPVAIAGVMGGQETAVGDDTSNIVLEVAAFRAYAIQETSRKLGLRSESSARFSKGIHPEVTGIAAKRIVYLLQEVAGVSVDSVVDTRPTVDAQHVIPFRPSRVAQVAGIAIDTDEMADILRRLRCTVDESNEVWEVAVPYDRLDLEGEHNLVEEVVRVYGLDQITSTSQKETSAVPIPTSIVLQHRLRDDFVALGLTETLNYSYEPEKYAKVMELDTVPHIEIANPPAPELSKMRVSLLPGLVGNLVQNRDVFQKQAGRKESSLFEIGNVYVPGVSDRVPGVIEQTHVAGVVVGAAPTREEIEQAIADAFGVEVEVVQQVEVTPVIPENVGRAIKYRTAITMFEYNVSALLLHTERADEDAVALSDLQLESDTPQFIPYSKYPSAMRDVSMLVVPEVTPEIAQEVIERVGGGLVVDVDLFDELEWKETGRKSLAFHIEYQADDRTLTDAEVTKTHSAIITALTQDLEAEIR